MRRETFIKGVTIAFREEKIVRDMAQTVGLNVSDVCRRALRKELGVALAENQSVPVDMVDQVLQVPRCQNAARFSSYFQVSGNISGSRLQMSKPALNVSNLYRMRSGLSRTVTPGTTRAGSPPAILVATFASIWEELQIQIRKNYNLDVSLNELYDYFKGIEV